MKHLFELFGTVAIIAAVFYCLDIRFNVACKKLQRVISLYKYRIKTKVI
jgi:hypothetical protein